MNAPLISRREALVWAAAFLTVATLLVVTRFTSTDADSMLYAGLSARLADEPLSRWIAPEWWGLWPRIGNTGLYRDHPIGGFALPALLGRIGVPDEQAAYVVGIGAGLVALVLIGRLVARLTTRDDARAVLVLLQIMPVAFVFRIRANQEYTMLICLIATIIGLDKVRRSWWGFGWVVAGLSAAVIIKGAFVLLTLVGAGTWVLCNPPRTPGSILRPIGALVASLVALAAVVAGYDAWYVHVTGESFWRNYWDIQLGIVTVSTPLTDVVTFVRHAAFYIVRLIWHPAPWSLALVAGAWSWRGHGVASWRALPEGARYGLLFALAYALVLLLMLSPSSRVAERYVFSGTYSIATAGIVAAYRSWRPLRSAIRHLDGRVVALPALVWLTLMVARLGIGPLIPRVFWN